MEVKFNELSKDQQKDVKSVLSGNGLKISGNKFYKDGSNVAIELKDGTIIKVNF